MGIQRVDDIISEIRRTGGRVTQARRMVVERIVANGDHHLTAPDLIEELRADDPEFHESTVYRVLDRLTDIGVVAPVQVHSGATVFHLTGVDHTHHHLLCTDCGSVVETASSALVDLARQMEQDQGFALRLDAPITFTGRCARCGGRSEPTAG